MNLPDNITTSPGLSQEVIALIVIMSALAYDNLKHHYISDRFLKDPVIVLKNVAWTIIVVLLIFVTIYLIEPSYQKIFLAFLTIGYTAYTFLSRDVYRLTPVVLPVIVFHLLYPIEMWSLFFNIYTVTTSYISLAIDNPLPVLAALFAYMSWREIYVPNRSEKEKELHDHFHNIILPKNKKDRIHRAKGSMTFGTEEAKFRKEPGETIFVELTITRVIVNNKPGLRHQILKYFPFGNFQGATEFTIRSQSRLPPEDQLWAFLAGISYVDEIERIDDFNFRVAFSSANVDELDNLLYKLYISVMNTYSLFEDDTPVSGRVVCGMVKYQRPSSLITYLLSRKEINNMRKLFRSRSSGVIIKSDPMDGFERIKHYQHDGWVRGFYFSLKHFIERIHPGIDHSNREPSHHQSISHGSHYLRQVYADTTIHGERPSERSSFDCTELAVEVNPTAEKEGVCHQIPISDFRLEDLDSVEFSDLSFDFLSTDIAKEEVLGKELTAEFLSVDKTNVDVTYKDDSDCLIGTRWTISGDAFITYARYEPDSSEPILSPYLPGIRWKRSN
ncbi:hypothetical protein ACLI4Y_10605 [Natrialbaceae archaeon A-CW3]